MVEGLGRFIKSRVRQGLIQGWNWGHGLPPPSHLQFVDDTGLMGATKINETANFRRALDFYMRALG